jgi:predicted RNase H-like HicB family nuclease
MNELLFSVHLERLPEGCYLATSEDLPGLVAQGRTINETLEIARDVARKLIDSYREHGTKLPAKLKCKVIRSLDVSLAVGMT